jgi:hypothetical protein
VLGGEPPGEQRQLDDWSIPNRKKPNRPTRSAAANYHAFASNARTGHRAKEPPIEPLIHSSGEFDLRAPPLN